MTDPEPHLPLKPVDLHLLLSLATEELHGYALVQRLEEESGGAIRLAPGNLYQILRRMMDAGLIDESERRPTRDEDQRRRYYRLTELGRAALQAETERLREVVRQAEARAVVPREAPA